jgi:DNA-binding MarR family transcriptional regulator
VSTLVGQLADAGVLERRTDEADRRVVRLTLNPGIRRRVDAVRDLRLEALGEAMDRLSPEERKLLDEATPVLLRIADELQNEGDAR